LEEVPKMSVSINEFRGHIWARKHPESSQLKYGGPSCCPLLKPNEFYVWKKHIYITLLFSLKQRSAFCFYVCN
jgi:hypothetical protein